MAKIVRRSNFFKRKKKWEHFKLKVKNTILKLSLFANICLGVHIYDPSITEKLTNNSVDIYNQVAPMVESLINQLIN